VSQIQVRPNLPLCQKMKISQLTYSLSVSGRQSTLETPKMYKNSNFHDLANDFASEIQAERDLSDATIADYRLQLDTVRKFAKKRSLSQNVGTWPPTIFQDCLIWLGESQTASFGSLGRKRKAFTEFSRFLKIRMPSAGFDHVAISAMPIAKLAAKATPDPGQDEVIVAPRAMQARPRGSFRFDVSKLPKGLAEFQRLIGQYLTFLRQERGASPNTIRLYRYGLRSLLHFLKAEHLDITPRSFDKGLFFEFLTSQQDRQLSASTTTQLFTALRGFFKFLLQTRYIQSNPFEFIKTPKLKRGLPRPLSLGDLSRLLLVIDPLIHQERRDLLIIELQVGSGLRISESATLKVKDLILEGGGLGPRLTATGKGRKQRIVPMSDISVALAKKWIADLRLQPDDFLFPSPKRKAAHFRQTSFERRFKIYLQRAGLDQAISPHCLRHTFATLLADSNVDIQAIQEMLGHSSLSTTQIYTKISSPRMHMLHRKNHPRNIQTGASSDGAGRIAIEAR
jgi:integrase/recombinase XerD